MQSTNIKPSNTLSPLRNISTLNSTWKLLFLVKIEI
jgi:hypothetical protein